MDRLAALQIAADVGRYASQEDAEWTDLADALDRVHASASAFGEGFETSAEDLDGYAAVVGICSDLTGMVPLKPYQSG